MTAQVPEVLHYEGADHSMCTEPLEQYFDLGGQKPRFMCLSSALWRGYVGRWEIVGGRLYLIELRGTLADRTEASLAALFPGFPERVFAHWYCGTIRLVQGKMIEYVHGGYASTYERDLLLEVECGVIKATRIQHNGLAAEEAPEGYRIGGMTTFSPPLES